MWIPLIISWVQREELYLGLGNEITFSITSTQVCLSISDLVMSYDQFCETESLFNRLMWVPTINSCPRRNVRNYFPKEIFSCSGLETSEILSVRSIAEVRSLVFSNYIEEGEPHRKVWMLSSLLAAGRAENWSNREMSENFRRNHMSMSQFLKWNLQCVYEVCSVLTPVDRAAYSLTISACYPG